MSRHFGSPVGKFRFRMCDERPEIDPVEEGHDDPGEFPGIDGLEGGGGGGSLPGLAGLSAGGEGPAADTQDLESREEGDSAPDTPGLGGGGDGPSLP